MINVVVTVVTLVCLGALALEALGFIISCAVKKRPERIAFIRGFKMGNCALIFITAIPLYWVGHVYSGQNIINGFFTAINKIINLVVLKYDSSTIEKLMDDNLLYKVTIYICFIFVGINAVLFTLSFTGQQLWNFFGWLGRRLSSRDHLVIFGNNENSRAIYESDDKKRAKCVVSELSKEEQLSLYQRHIYYSSTKSLDKQISHFINDASRSKKSSYVAVINTENDEKNIELCRIFITAIKQKAKKLQEQRDKKEAELKRKQEKRAKKQGEEQPVKQDKEQSEKKKKEGKEEAILFEKIRVYVFGDPRYQTIYDDIVSDSLGCIHYQNKYQKIAMDFIDKYPLAFFMDEAQIDYETSLVKKGIDVNMIMIGFGKTSQQIFLTSVANNQFLRRPLIKLDDGTEVEDKEAEPMLKRVDYYIFDKHQAENNKNLNHSYYRFKNECEGGSIKEYLPLPVRPADEHFAKHDVNDNEFYNKIKSIVDRNPKDANFVVISFSSDLENIDMAQKLIEKRREWGKEDLIIFVKARHFHKEDTLISEKNCYFIGYENDVVYNIEKILGDDIYKMAKMRNQIYDIEYYITKKNKNPSTEDVEAVKKACETKWYREMLQMLRESSLYCCLSLRSKLNLMGLDYKKLTGDKEKDKDALTYEEYINTYAYNCKPPKVIEGVAVENKPIVDYSEEMELHNRRTYLAIHEHQRWNSFMISKGLIPSTLDQIFKEKRNGEYTNGKRYDARRHGNITTFGGLVGFRRLVAYRENALALESEELKKSLLENASYEDIIANPQPNELTYDVIRYDYQLLDDAFWLLSENGFKIVRKERVK